jgi:dihydroorotate dehydrogenase (NAD+) catalytic subunit
VFAKRALSSIWKISSGIRGDSVRDPDLTVKMGRLILKNPVIVSSGTFGFGQEFEDFFDLNQLGALIPKGISLTPMEGNPPPRLFETEGGMLNSIGLQNPGFEAFIKNKLPYYKDLKTHLIVNFFGNTRKEYVELARRFDQAPGISALEMNISCPNIKREGIVFGTDPKMSYRLVQAVRKVTALPLIVKLSPNVTDIGLMAKSVVEGGADAVSLVNTFRAMAINIHTRKPELGNIIGGLSGPAIKPIALRMVWEVSQAVQVPVIGMGGIMNAEDAIEFILVGASAIQIGTANLINPKTGIEVIEGIKKYLVQNRMNRIQKLIGNFKINQAP